MIDQQTTELIEKFGSVLKEGAVFAYDKIQTMAPKLWAMARWQTQLDGIECLFGALMIAVLFMVILHQSKKAIVKKDASYSDWTEGNHRIVVIIGSLLTIAFSLPLVLAFCDYTLNPDWWTLKALVELVKGAK